MMTKIAQPFHEAVAEKLIRLLQEGTAPWQKGWQPGEPGALLPMNPMTGKRYQGINAIQLMSQGHADPRWLSYKQAAAMGAQVRKGERGTPIQYWKFSEAHDKTDALGNPVRDEEGRRVREDQPLERPRVFMAIVFHASQIDGLAPMPAQQAAEWPSLERAEHLLRTSGATLVHAVQNRAFYRPVTDSIHLPDRAHFSSAAHYYATALHEIGHWTGHPSRLNRDLSHPFGSAGYAMEELRAELASMILSRELRLGHDPAQHASYVASWIKILQNNPLEIFRAAADAEKIQRFVLGLEQAQERRQSQGASALPIDTSPPQATEAQMHTSLRQGSGRTAPAESVHTFLAVPFNEHKDAKALGARWDRRQRSWYVPVHLDPVAFVRWLPNISKTATDLPETAHAPGRTALDQAPPSERLYLAVPFAERALARVAGAAWDRAAKSWYAGPHADLQALDRWRPENRTHEQGPAMHPREEFAVAMQAHGLLVTGDHPIMDGHKHRIAVEGGKRGALDGFYVGYMDGHPAGRIINYKTGADVTWHCKGYVLSREQATALQAQASVRRQARVAEQAQLHERTAKRLLRELGELVPLAQATPYLQRKGIKPQSGIFADREGQVTYVPGMDADGKLWTIQAIQADGTKRFAKDSRKEGCFHVLGGVPALAHAPALVISEGYATAGSLSQSLGFATIAAFDAGNLVYVAKALQQKFPAKPVIIAGDDDRHLALTHGVNTGRIKAQEAAAATGGHLLLPIFAPGEGSYLAGLSPITPECYRAHGRTGAGLSKTQLAALEQMKRHTDFNDLATRSVLGPDAIDRQVRPFVSAVVRQHQACAEHQQRQAHGAECLEYSIRVSGA